MLYFNVNTETSRTFAFTLFALIAFAGNSVLRRLALVDNTIDAANFTIIRLVSGIIALLVIVKFASNNSELPSKGSWTASFMLFLYAVAFSSCPIHLVSVAFGAGVRNK